MSNPTELIKAKAYDLGFSLAGITQPQPHSDYHHYLKWIAQERFGEMEYLARKDAINTRANPKKLFTTCKSCLVVGMIYPTQIPTELTSQKIGEGLIAAYASRFDYHEVISQRLMQLHNQLEKELNSTIQVKIFCDSSPILEKSLAQSAGLGWIGRNSLLISPKFGSLFNIGGQLLNIELDPSTPFQKDLCGNCRKCIKACPTHCLQSNRTLIANRCISYLTIEHKGIIEREIRPLIGSWTFGCDVCQIVCPYNQNVHSQKEKPALNTSINLIDNLTLSEKDFKQLYQHTSIQRIGFHQFLRNIIIAVGNQQFISAIPLLTHHLTISQDFLIRGYSAWALGQMRTTNGKIVLQNHLNNETDSFVREEIQAALEV